MEKSGNSSQNRQVCESLPDYYTKRFYLRLNTTNCNVTKLWNDPLQIRYNLKNPKLFPQGIAAGKRKNFGSY